jgi:hypothetical protein
MTPPAAAERKSLTLASRRSAMVTAMYGVREM